MVNLLIIRDSSHAMMSTFQRVKSSSRQLVNEVTLKYTHVKALASSSSKVCWLNVGVQPPRPRQYFSCHCCLVDIFLSVRFALSTEY